jgi:E3 ubiquitin-protein ligase makorin
VAKHEEDMRHSFELAASMDKQCSICFDTILEKTSQSEQRFGILPMCNHVFCLACIRKWRQQKENVVVPTKVRVQITSDESLLQQILAVCAL